MPVFKTFKNATFAMTALILIRGVYWRRALNRMNAAELQLNNNLSSIYNLLTLALNPEYIFGGLCARISRFDKRREVCWKLHSALRHAHYMGES